MTKKASSNRRISITAVIGILCLVFALLYAPAFFSSKAGSRKADTPSRPENYDIRRDKGAFGKMAELRGRSGRSAVSVADTRDEFVRGESALKARVPSLKVEYNPAMQTPEIIDAAPANGRGSLMSRANSGRAESLRAFAKDNASLVGLSHSQSDELKVVADYANPDGGLSYATLEQHVNGVPVFQGEIKAGFNKNGEMFRVVNELAPGLDYGSVSPDFGDSTAALRIAMSDLKVDAGSVDLSVNENRSNELKQTFGTGDWPATAEKMYFPTEPGVAIPAWRVLVWKDSVGYYEIVDPVSNTILWRKCITNDQTQPATYNVYAASNNIIKALDSPSPTNPSTIFGVGSDPASVVSFQPLPATRTDITLIGNEGSLSFNNLGWIADNTNAGNGETQGNNVIAGLDLVGGNGVDAPQPGSGRVFSFDYTPATVSGANAAPFTCCTEVGEPPAGGTFRSGAVTHLFYLANRYHDALYQVGFTEAARNFQNDNFGRGGLGSDRVSAEAQDSSGDNNANFSTVADGSGVGRMQMYVFTGGAIARDGSLDATVVLHEMTHGVSNRLIGNASGLNTDQAGGMGEGWSDLYAFLLLSKSSDPVNGVYTTGAYATYRCCGLPSYTQNYYYGIRRFPLAMINVTGGPSNRPYNPLTFADIDPAQLSLIDGAFAKSPLIGGPANEVHNEGELWAVTGVEVWGRLVNRLSHDAGTLRTLQLYTDGMKLSPVEPSFLQERDAIVAAAQALGGSDVSDIWAAFAARGMGASARVVSGNTVVQAFDLPGISQTENITVNDTTGNNTGFADPGELVTVNIPFTNNSGQTVTGVSFQLVGGGSANLASIPNGSVAIAQLQLNIPAATSCGAALAITINVNSSLGASVFNRTIPIGAPVQTLTENFDGVAAPGLPAGWTAAPTLGSTNFASVTFLSDTAPSSVFVADPSSAAGAADFTSPSLPITSSAATVSFRHRFDTETAWDGGVLELSIGGGAFADILTAGGRFLAGGYNGTMAAVSSGGTYVANPLGGKSGWTGNSGGFMTTSIQLPVTAGGQSVRLRWRFGADSNGVGSGPNPGWYIDTVKVFGSATCTGVTTTTVHTPFDFDGDHKTDISIFRPGAESEWWYQRSSNGSVAAGPFGTSTDIPTPADFTGDGKTDVAFFRPSTGTWFILRSEDNSYFALPFGTSGDIPAQADFDGDGKADTAVFRPSTGTWFIDRSSGAGTIITTFGVNGDQPVAADYDNDGKADIAIVRSNNGNKEWWIQRSTAGIIATNFGVPTDKAVAGDYTGDGRADIAVWRPSSGTWFIMRSEDFSFFSTPFGSNGDIPTPGDYDGDGKYDFAVFRPSGSTWFVNRSTGAGTTIGNFGSSTDIPVPSTSVR